MGALDSPNASADWYHDYIEINQLRAKMKAALDILKEVEWSGKDGICPVCKENKDPHDHKYNQHADNCKLAKAIEKLK